MKDYREVALAVCLARYRRVRTYADVTEVPDDSELRTIYSLADDFMVDVVLRDGTIISASSASWVIPPNVLRPWVALYHGREQVAIVNPKEVEKVE